MIHKLCDNYLTFYSVEYLSEPIHKINIQATIFRINISDTICS